jgi:ATP-dependent RNA circularization protein (DNA/RNA ligase family)
MKTYHKIQTIFLREVEAGRGVPVTEGKWSKREFEALKDIDWLMTEKVDGTNIRVIWDNEKVLVRGKTDNAQMYPGMYEKLQELFTLDKMKHYFPMSEGRVVTFYGEGYGAKIQKGGTYIPDGVDFILFDVLSTKDGNELWFSHEALVETSFALNIKIVPLVAVGPLSKAVDMCKNGFDSRLRKEPPEGLVIKPKVELKDCRGNRIITKLKLSDFKK